MQCSRRSKAKACGSTQRQDGAAVVPVLQLQRVAKQRRTRYQQRKFELPWQHGKDRGKFGLLERQRRMWDHPSVMQTKLACCTIALEGERRRPLEPLASSWLNLSTYFDGTRQTCVFNVVQSLHPRVIRNLRMLLVLQLLFVFIRRKVDMREFLLCARIGTFMSKCTAYVGQQSRLVVLPQT